jgi:Secretion system C-terminal sorting domain
MKKQIVNFSTILLLLFSMLVVSCKADEPIPNDIQMYVYPNPNKGIISIEVNNKSDQTYQLIIIDPEGNKMSETNGDKKSQKSYNFNLKADKDRTGIFYAILETSNSLIKTRIFVT